MVYHILTDSYKCHIPFFVALETKAMNKTIPLKNQIATTWKKQLQPPLFTQSDDVNAQRNIFVTLILF